MRIEDYIFDNITYKAYSPREVRDMFRSWKDNLTRVEKKAFANYRKRFSYNNNINDKLRNKSLPCDAVTISNAIKKRFYQNTLLFFAD